MKSKFSGIRKCIFTPEFREDLSWWVKADRKAAMKVLETVEAVMRNPSEGIGKPEPLLFLGSNVWSRRITLEHRLVYMIMDDRIEFLQCRHHY